MAGSIVSQVKRLLLLQNNRKYKWQIQAFEWEGVAKKTDRQDIFWIIDTAVINANILYNTLTESKMTHQKFVNALGQELIRDNWIRRAKMVNIPRQLIELIRWFGNIP